MSQPPASSTLTTSRTTPAHTYTAVTALFVAAKMEEIYPPKAQEMAATTGGATAAKDILAFEQDLMTTLNWNLAPPTVDDWAEG